ncbi:MAG: type transport system permease protein [Patescibacteria group bacterium]|jgi:ABC-2 type transport system permease protein/oleandomycin transport system permease protein|nr:type transport system permease protein [Patescibacteria group bacterium]
MNVSNPSMVQSARMTISDVLAITKRNLIRFKRTPEILIFSSIQPVMFLLLFNYVFGGAIGVATPGTSYINFLLPGIMAQTALFSTLQTPIALVDDLDKGAIDRFRSLPMSRGAVLAGRTFADSLRSLFIVVLMFVIGTLLGFRYQAGGGKMILALLLLVSFSYAFSWLTATLGLFIRNAEAVQTAGFLFVFPLTFASSVFVPVVTMPGWLQVFARNQPVTQLVNAMRALMIGGVAIDAVYITIAWTIGILVVFVPLAIWKFKRTV